MKPIRFTTVRRIGAGVVIGIFLMLLAFTAYIWLSFSDALDENISVGEDRRLLTDFDTSKFDEAVSRLEKRRNLEGSAGEVRDPFGTLPR